MCRFAAHAAYGGNKPMPQWAFFEVRYSGLDPKSSGFAKADGILG